jgi:hypothetical protein
MCQDLRSSKAFVSAIFEYVKLPTRYEWSNIRRPLQLYVIGGYNAMSQDKTFQNISRAARKVITKFPERY